MLTLSEKLNIKHIFDIFDVRIMHKKCVHNATSRAHTHTAKDKNKTNKKFLLINRFVTLIFNTAANLARRDFATFLELRG